MASSSMKWKGARTTCIGWCLLCCVWRRGRWATTKLLPHAVGHLRHIVGKRVTPHSCPTRRPWLFQGAAANAAFVVILVVAKTELCCNDYKGGPLLKLLSAYRPCNSHWLSSIQTGWLLPDVATQGLPNLSLVSVGRKWLAKKKMNQVFCAACVVHCFLL